MSFLGSKGEARSIINEIEESDTKGSGGSSPILNGSASGGGAKKPAGETMSQKRTSLKVATSGLKRKG
jgi:hypothetical protein